MTSCLFGQFEAIFGGNYAKLTSGELHSSPRRNYVISPRHMFLTWQHLVPTSFLKLMLLTSFAHFRRYNFSLVHKLHILSPGLKFLHSFI